VAGTLDVTGATTLDSTLAVVGNSTANSMNLGGRTLGAGGTPLGVNFSSASTNGMQINDTNSGNLGGMIGFYSGSGTGTLRGNIQNANNTGIHVCVGTSGTITFGNTGYTAANALDDYEEGTWTPTIAGTGNSIHTGQAYGRYIKIGKLVTAFVLINDNTNNTFGSGDITFTGLPFTSANQVGITNTSAVRHRFISPPSNTTQLLAWVNTNSDTVILEWSGSAGFVRLSGSHVNNSNSCAMAFGVTYETT